MLIIPLGKRVTVLNKSVTGSGTVTTCHSIESDSVLVSLYVDAITSGSIDVVVSTSTLEGHTKDIITFPTITAPTTELLLKKAALAMDNIIVTVTHTGDCTFEVSAKGLTAGQTSVKIEGVENLRFTRTPVTAGTPVKLVSASLDDRAGILIKNTSTTATMFISNTSAGTAVPGGNSYPLSPGEPVAMDVQSGEELWADISAGTDDASIVEGGG